MIWIALAFFACGIFNVTAIYGIRNDLDDGENLSARIGMGALALFNSGAGASGLSMAIYWALK